MNSYLMASTFQMLSVGYYEVTSVQATDTDRPVESMLDFSTTTQAFFDPGGIGGDEVLITITLDNDWSANAIALAVHSIPDGTDIEIRDGISGLVIDTVTTVGTGPQLLRFPGQTTSEYTVKLLLTDQAPVTIASFYLGNTLTLTDIQAPWAPANLAGVTTTYPHVTSKGGAYLGTNVKRQGVEFEIVQERLNPTLLQFVWTEFSTRLNRYPFFVLWDSDNVATSVYAWKVGPLPPPVYANPVQMSWRMKCRGISAGDT